MPEGLAELLKLIFAGVKVCKWVIKVLANFTHKTQKRQRERKITSDQHVSEA